MKTTLKLHFNIFSVLNTLTRDIQCEKIFEDTSVSHVMQKYLTVDSLQPLVLIIGTYSCATPHAKDPLRLFPSIALRIPTAHNITRDKHARIKKWRLFLCGWTSPKR